ncbi:hypothetical protein GGR50DRAFT_698052 [Xylaria sp. CBS 124048]|nr:hypothetical protein GGR50DRAFT_698052 [Xylaria sp. CBS 124048]
MLHLHHLELSKIAWDSMSRRRRSTFFLLSRLSYKAERRPYPPSFRPEGRTINKAIERIARQRIRTEPATAQRGLLHANGDQTGASASGQLKAHRKINRGARAEVHEGRLQTGRGFPQIISVLSGSSPSSSTRTTHVPRIAPIQRNSNSIVALSWNPLVTVWLKIIALYRNMIEKVEPWTRCCPSKSLFTKDYDHLEPGEKNPRTSTTDSASLRLCDENGNEHSEELEELNEIEALDFGADVVNGDGLRPKLCLGYRWASWSTLFHPGPGSVKGKGARSHTPAVDKPSQLAV